MFLTCLNLNSHVYFVQKKKNYQKDIVFFFHFAMDNVFSTKKKCRKPK